MKTLFKLLIILALDVQFGWTDTLWKFTGGMITFTDFDARMVYQCTFWACFLLLPDYISSFIKPDIALTFLLLGNSKSAESNEQETKDVLDKAGDWITYQVEQIPKCIINTFGDGEDLLRDKLEHSQELGDDLEGSK